MLCVSLTSELKNPDSDISRYFARHLPNVTPLAEHVSRWAVRLPRPTGPFGHIDIPWRYLGHTIDHRIRVTLGVPHGSPIRVGVKMLEGWLWDIKCGNEGARPALHRAGLQMLAELETYDRPPLVHETVEEGERLIRLCFIASCFERVFRSGEVDADSLLLRVGVDATLATLLAEVPRFVIDDITAQLRLAQDQDALGWMIGQDGVCGPVFAGSTDVGGADADFIFGGELVDCKATVHPRRLGVSELYQLAGYLLLDYDDQFQIRFLSLYLSRQGASIGWCVEEFLAILGARASVAELRKGLSETLAPHGRSRRTAEPARETAAQTTRVLTAPCPKCRAATGVPCTTSGGKLARRPHSYR
jgi:hypothetical protein